MGWSPHRKTGLTYHAPGQSLKGYTLITAMGGGDASYLIDMDGRIVHRWRFTTIRPNYARLLPGGSLLVIGVDASITAPMIAPGTAPTVDQALRTMGGNATQLLEVDWDGKVTWEYANPAIHHDFVRLANGNTLLPLWVELDAGLAREVRGGFRERPQPAMFGDDILEIDARGKEVRRISLSKLLDPRRDPICSLERRLEWTHLNGLDVTRSGDVVFSCRTVSRVGIVDRASGKLVWKYGFPDVSHQHHPTVLANGNIQVYDNGMHRRGMPRSRVVEIDPKDSSVAWQYVGEPEQQFFSGHISGAERLANDSVLVCEGVSGRIFEVTRKGEVVWEWLSPFAHRVSGVTRSWVFRAHRYSPDHGALAGRDLDPGRYAALNRMYGLDS